MKTLFSWVGNTDLEAINSENDFGPIARLLSHKHYDQIILLFDYKPDDKEDKLKKGHRYKEWLHENSGIPVEFYSYELEDPTDIKDIFCVIREILGYPPEHLKYGDLTFLTSPGTPAMSATWILLASQYNATLIESSRERGIIEINLPIPNYELLKKGLKEFFDKQLNYHIFMSWIGNRDRKPDEGTKGPIIDFIQKQQQQGYQYQEIVLIYEDEEKFRENNSSFLQRMKDHFPNININHEPCNPENKELETLYRLTLKFTKNYLSKYPRSGIHVLTSPGMPNMNTSWFLLAMQYPQLKLWKTSKEHNNQLIELPTD